MTTYVVTFVETSTKYTLIPALSEAHAIATLRDQHRAGNITGVDTGDYQITKIIDVREDRP